MSNWLSLCVSQSELFVSYSKPVLFFYPPVCDSAMRSSANKLWSLGDFSSYNLESFHFSLFPRQILVFQLNIILHDLYYWYHIRSVRKQAWEFADTTKLWEITNNETHCFLMEEEFAHLDTSV